VSVISPRSGEPWPLFAVVSSTAGDTAINGSSMRAPTLVPSPLVHSPVPKLGVQREVYLT
jgi:hypothetical protein